MSGAPDCVLGLGHGVWQALGELEGKTLVCPQQGTHRGARVLLCSGPGTRGCLGGFRLRQAALAAMGHACVQPHAMAWQSPVQDVSSHTCFRCSEEMFVHSRLR